MKHEAQPTPQKGFLRCLLPSKGGLLEKGAKSFSALVVATSPVTLPVLASRVEAAPAQSVEINPYCVEDGGKWHVEFGIKIPPMSTEDDITAIGGDFSGGDGKVKTTHLEAKNYTQSYNIYTNQQSFNGLAGLDFAKQNEYDKTRDVAASCPSDQYPNEHQGGNPTVPSSLPKSTETTATTASTTSTTKKAERPTTTTTAKKVEAAAPTTTTTSSLPDSTTTTFVSVPSTANPASTVTSIETTVSQPAQESTSSTSDTTQQKKNSGSSKGGWSNLKIAGAITVMVTGTGLASWGAVALMRKQQKSGGLPPTTGQPTPAGSR